MDSILAEFIGTTILMLLGIGVNANTSLKKQLVEKTLIGF